MIEKSIREKIIQESDFEAASCYEDALCEDSRIKSPAEDAKIKKLAWAVNFTSQVFQTLIDEEATIYLPPPEPEKVAVETSSALVESLANFVGEIKRSLISDAALELMKVLQSRKCVSIMLSITIIGCLSIFKIRDNFLFLLFLLLFLILCNIWIGILNYCQLTASAEIEKTA